MKYKTKEAAGLDKSVAELGSDKSGVETELAAVLEYFAKIEGDCSAKAETYEEFNFVLGAAVGIGASVAGAHWV